MICALSPADYNYDETVSTLKYGNRAKQIKNAPKVNEDPKDAQLREFVDEIARLKKMLADNPGGIPLDINMTASEAEDFRGELPQTGKKVSEEEQKRLSLLKKQHLQKTEEQKKLGSELKNTD